MANCSVCVANAPSPNGITMNTKNTQVYVAVTRAQQIWRLPLMAGGTPSKTGVAIQLSGGHAGPDGIEMDAEDGLMVCHLGVGIWRFDANCLPTHLRARWRGASADDQRRVQGQDAVTSPIP